MIISVTGYTGLIADLEEADGGAESGEDAGKLVRLRGDSLPFWSTLKSST